MFLFITHRTYDKRKIKKAGIDQLLSFLSKKEKCLLIEHPIESDYPFSKLKEIYKNKEILLKRKKKIISQRLTEFVFNLSQTFIFRPKIIISVNAFNTFSVIFLKLINRNTKIYFFIADYSENRFNQKIFDLIYKILFKISLKFSDKIFVVSKRIYKFLAPSFEKKLIWLPNSPHFKLIPKISPNQKNKFSLVFSAGRLTQRVNLAGLFKTIKILQKKFPTIELNLIGKTNKEVYDLIKAFEIENQVKIYDFLNHKEALKIISLSYIGLSWYSRKVSHLFWGDSLKIREYAAAGLPIVTDGLTSTAQEMVKFKAGFIITTSQEMAEKITQLIENKKLYLKIRKNALSWAENMDKEKILTSLTPLFD